MKAFLGFLLAFLSVSAYASHPLQGTLGPCYWFSDRDPGYSKSASVSPAWPCAGDGDFCMLVYNGVATGDKCFFLEPPSNSCNTKSGIVHSSGYYDMGLSDQNDPARLACDDGCETSYTGSGIDSRTMINGQYHYGAQGSYTFTGNECSSGDPSVSASPSPPDTACDPATQVEGVIAGKTVCFSKGSTNTQTDVQIDPVTGTRTETTVTYHPDGSSTSKITIKTTDPLTGSTSENTHTTSNPSSGGGYSPDSFCLAHPNDPTCLADAAGPQSGSGTGGDCKDKPDTLGCAKMSGTPDAGDMPSSERDIALISPVSIGGTGQCPAPLSAFFLGQRVEFSFDPLCEYANSLRPLVLTLAWLAAGVIFIGGVRS